MSLVEVRGLHKSFHSNSSRGSSSHNRPSRDNTVLRGIDLSVDEGSVTVLIGPSGAGKTTALRCLNGLTVPEKGVVEIGPVSVDFGQSPSTQQIRELRAQTGFVFQSHQLFPHRTALENLTEGPIYVFHESRGQAEDRARDLLAQVGLADKADSYPSALSGGQQQRVGIARALMLRPRLLLFDEPTSALDPQLVGEVLVVMRDLARSGWTMIVVTHEMRFATQVADHVAFLDDGVILEQGPPDQVLHHPIHDRVQQFLRRVIDPLAEA